MYIDNIVAISIDPTEIVKSMEGKTVKYKNGKNSSSRTGRKTEKKRDQWKHVMYHHQV